MPRWTRWRHPFLGHYYGDALRAAPFIRTWMQHVQSRRITLTAPGSEGAVIRTCRLREPRENPAPLLSAYSQIGVICLGVSGEVFQSSQYVLEALGLTGSERGTLLTHLHKITIQYLARILSTRRKMDHIQTDVEGKKKPPTESQGKKDMKASKRKNPSTPSPVGSNATKKQRRKAPKAPTGIG